MLRTPSVREPVTAVSETTRAVVSPSVLAFPRRTRVRGARVVRIVDVTVGIPPSNAVEGLLPTDDAGLRSPP